MRNTSMAMLRRAVSLFMATALCSQPVLAQTPAIVTPQPAPSAAVAPYITEIGAADRDETIRQLRQKVKYVFVIFNENRSFDHIFGSFPGANGLYADQNGPLDAVHTPGFTQAYTDDLGVARTATPFRVGPEQNASFSDSVDHSHTGLARKLHVVDRKPTMDQFALADYSRVAKKDNDATIAMGN